MLSSNEGEKISFDDQGTVKPEVAATRHSKDSSDLNRLKTEGSKRVRIQGKLNGMPLPVSDVSSMNETLKVGQSSMASQKKQVITVQKMSENTHV